MQRLTSATLGDVRHGFFTREGGVSGGIYASLNCGIGSSDDRAAVLENRARVAAEMGVEADRLLFVHQVHSARAVATTGPWEGTPPEVDAMVTATPGVALAALAADCVPALFHDPEAGVIGAAHSGWRGALSGVLEATLEAMEGLGADRARVRWGPASPRPPTRSGRSSSRTSPRTTRRRSGSSPAGPTGGRCSTFRATPCAGSGRRAWRRRHGSGAAPMATRRGSTRIAG